METDIKVNIGDLGGNMQIQPPTAKDSKFGFPSSFTTRIPNVGEILRQIRQGIRAWTEFVNIQNFKSVGNAQRLTTRFMRNLVYFQSNYLIVSLVLFIYCMITSPLILLVLVGVMYSCYKIKQIQAPITLFGRPLNTNQQCILVSVAALPILYLLHAGSAMFWVLGASCFIISLHAAFYNIDAIVTEDTEGFLMAEETV